LDIGNDILNNMPVTREIIARIDKQHYVNLKASACKGNNQQSEDAACRTGKRIF
jgi:hypothetical protein